jgi:CDP-2,3-bis-(O-geranylgeranyl)-sn-glycerol synthase
MDWLLLLGCMWFFLPAGVANMAPVFATKIFGAGRPIDGGRSWRGVRIFGDHKTWQGLVAGAVLGGLFFLVQRQLSMAGIITLRGADAASYAAVPVFLGFLLGLGAMLGDAVKSFFKRRYAHMPPGGAWVPFDQVDWVIGGMVAIYAFVSWPWWVWIGLLAAYGLLHPVANILGWLMRLKKNKF